MRCCAEAMPEVSDKPRKAAMKAMFRMADICKTDQVPGGRQKAKNLEVAANRSDVAEERPETSEET